MTCYVPAASGPPSNRYNTTFLKASQFVETDEAYKGNAIQDRKIQDRGTQINFRLNLKRDFSFLLALVEIPGWIDCILFKPGFFLLFLFSFTFFFSLFFLHVLCRHFATCYVLHAFLYTTLVCTSYQFCNFTCHIANRFFSFSNILHLGSLQGISSCYIVLHCFLAGVNIHNKNIIIYQ